MNFLIPIGQLQRALKAMSSVVKPNAKDASAYIAIDASTAGRVVFIAYNGKLAITHYVDGCEVEEPGRTCVSFIKVDKFINSFIQMSEGVGVETVRVKELKNNVALSLTNIHENKKKSNHRISLQIFPAHQVYIPKPFQETTFSVNAATLSDALAKVSYAVDKSSNRPFIQGMNMRFMGDYIYFAGTDGFKVSEYKVNNTGKIQDGSYIIPHIFMIALRKIMDLEGQVFIEVQGGTIKAAVGPTTLHGNLIIGETYPDYMPVFENYENQIVVDKDALMMTFMPYLNILNKDDNKRLTIQIKDSKIIVTSDNSEAEYAGDIEFADEFVVDVNGGYLAQTLEAIRDDIVEMRFSNDKGVLIFDSANFHDQRSLITPIKRRG